MSRPDFLVCDGFGCKCRDHITTATHIPACPRHGTVLRRLHGHPDRGVCPDCYQRAVRVLASGLGSVARAGLDVGLAGAAPIPTADYPADQWAWLPRDLYNGADLPPGNGYQPLDLTWMDDS